MKKIPLTQGKFALVDDIDYEYLSQWKWYANRCRNTFYARRNDYKDGKQTTVLMHKVISNRLRFKHRADHINRDGLDNRRRNLRDATVKQNNENTRRRRDNTSGHRGISWCRRKSKWWARIQHNGKRIHLGYFDKLEDAIAARKEAEKKYFTHRDKA